MSLVKLTDALAVNPASVHSVQVIRDSRYVTVRMTDGESHQIPCDYGKGIWETYSRVVDLITGSTPTAKPGNPGDLSP